MATQEIKYNGQTALPNDYSSPDGDLEVSLNLINEDGALRPLAKPSEVLEITTTDALPSEIKPKLWLHANNGAYDHYIVLLDGKDLYWIDKADSGHTRHFIRTIADVRQATTLGNTLCVLTDSKIHYFLWKNGGYAYLGDHIPEIPLSFGLQGHTDRSSNNQIGDANSINDSPFAESSFPKSPSVTFVKFPLDGDAVANNSFTKDAIERFFRKISDAVMAEVNKRIAVVSEDGEFCAPFLVRYALRLYDGSLTMHSAPVLMVPSTGCNPRAVIQGYRTNRYGGVYAFFYHITSLNCSLDYQCLDGNVPSTFADWRDIVKSVDVFVSSPIPKYNQAGHVEGIDNMSASMRGYYTIAKITNNPPSGGPQIAPPDNIHYAKSLLHPLLTDYHAYSTNWPNPDDANGQEYYSEYGWNEFVLPQHSDEVVQSNIRDCGTFYLLKSIKIEDLQTTRTKIDIPKGYLPTLNTREVMTDDYNSHDNVSGKVTHIYNSRLNLAHIIRNYANPANPATSLPYCDATFDFNEPTKSYTVNVLQASHVAKVELNKDGVTHHIKSKASDILHPLAPVLYYYHYNAAADYATMNVQLEQHSLVNPSVVTRREHVIYLPLERHLTLNGAVFFRGFDLNAPTYDSVLNGPWQTVQDFTEQPATSDISDISIHEPNKIYLSEVENPFFFPVTHITTVGSSEILGLSAATQELSQGQFGQFPLYVFTREGTWALSVSDKGTYLAKQIITRDVCDNPESITALDKAVAFCTARGIMLMQGSQAVCISDTIAEEYPFEMSKLHSFNRWLNIQDFQPEPFSEFLKGCRMLYDYRHQHLIVFNGSLDKVVLREYDPDDPPVIIDPDNPPLLTSAPNPPATSGDIPSGNVTIYAYPPHYRYAYVYSFKSKMWGMMESQGMYETVKSYPDTLAVKMVSEAENLQKYSVVSFTERDSVFPPQLLLTRPLTFGATDTLKEVNTVIQRGFFQRGDLKTVLYGSRDLMNWHLISSSTGNYLRHIHGTSYKYFRIVGLSAITDEHSIYGASVEAQARHTNRLR